MSSLDRPLVEAVRRIAAGLEQIAAAIRDHAAAVRSTTTPSKPEKPDPPKNSRARCTPSAATGCAARQGHQCE